MKKYIPQSHIVDHMPSHYYNILFISLDSPSYDRLPSLFSVKYIHLNKRLRSWFGSVTNKSPEELEKLLRVDDSKFVRGVKKIKRYLINIYPEYGFFIFNIPV